MQIYTSVSGMPPTLGDWFRQRSKNGVLDESQLPPSIVNPFSGDGFSKKLNTVCSCTLSYAKFVVWV